MKLIRSLLVFLILPAAGLSQGSSDDPNSLFVEAHQKFAVTAELGGATHFEMLRDIGAILKRIEKEFPESTPARLIREGGALGGIDLAAIRAVSDLRSREMPDATRRSIAATAERACRNLSASCKEDIGESLEGVIAAAVFAGPGNRAGASTHGVLFSDPAKIADPLMRVDAFAALSDDPGFAASGETWRQLLLSQVQTEDITSKIAADFGFGLVTAVVTELLAEAHEAAGKRQTAELVRSWIAPLVDLAQLEIGVAGKPATGASRIWAKDFLALVEISALQQADTGYDATTRRALDDIAADAESILRTFRTGMLTGRLFESSGRIGYPIWPELEEVLRDTLAQKYELQTWWLKNNEAGDLDELTFVLDNARRFVTPATPTPTPTLTQSNGSHGAAAPTEKPGRWGVEIVSGPHNVQNISSCAGPDAETCFRQKGVSEGGVAFLIANALTGLRALWVDSFEELGRVDLARARNMTNHPRTDLLLNGDPALIYPPARPPRAAFTDRASQRLLRAYPQTLVQFSHIAGHRNLPSGFQRFILEEMVSECMGCPTRGIGLSYLDFDKRGRLFGRRNIGIAAPGAKLQFDPDAENGGGSGWEHAQFERYPEALQFRLNRMGYDAGPMDGVLGDQTIEALKRFQSEWCLTRSGRRDEATLAALRSAVGPQPAFSEEGCPDTGGRPGLLGKYELMQQPSEINCQMAPLVVEAAKVLFYESTCQFDSPIPREAGEHQTQATCNGEGTNWRTAFRFRRETDASLRIDHLDRDATSYFRPCSIAPLPPADPAVFSNDAKALQSRLSALGFDAGPADGYPGPQTREALMRFQRSRCLAPTGQPDLDTRKALATAKQGGGECAGMPMPDGITANTPLRTGLYVNSNYSCESDDLTSSADISMRIVRGRSTTFSYNFQCETRRTDIRDGITQWSGECADGLVPFDVKWKLDVVSNTEFIETQSVFDFVEVDGVRQSPNGQRYIRCPDDSFQAREWSKWFE
ncbi:peptidoglycan-binding domain-containing protein [Aliiruegeria sabulilitoris]|uniref:peptidoglycan-binding domain-containing protein n=1 Tax=Aliiruegeria sabulilitoris TaxID=1510458 RepID=UPI00082AE1F7|nr:peptidoglycan-binding domain-containing protein [Aliiruegeria sabulilitoris]NDR55396.1 peptidoglycan-binding protein [Pseudoruegeria sp. M32A2M]